MNQQLHAKPRNFSWLIEGEIAGMGWPRTAEHLKFLVQAGISHLVTLSPDERPPKNALEQVPQLRWAEISIPEFEPPTIKQIDEFVHICAEARKKQQAIGVHCWQGRGRTGVMLACYLVKFCRMSPEMAINRVRLLRPGSVETYKQERVVIDYHDYLLRL